MAYHVAVPVVARPEISVARRLVTWSYVWHGPATWLGAVARPCVTSWLKGKNVVFDASGQGDFLKRRIIIIDDLAMRISCTSSGGTALLLACHRIYRPKANRSWKRQDVR